MIKKIIQKTFFRSEGLLLTNPRSRGWRVQYNELGEGQFSFPGQERKGGGGIESRVASTLLLNPVVAGEVTDFLGPNYLLLF